jgi:hypothetical protein
VSGQSRTFSQRVNISPADQFRTAVIKFLNGTLVGVAQIRGTSAYLTVIKQLAEAAAEYGRGQKQTL